MSDTEPSLPGAVPPERTRFVQSRGVRLHLCEWGDPTAAPVVLCHGMFDHARGFDQIAPLLSRRFRVVALDARGHGESDWADAYTWPSDVEDIGAVLADLGRRAHLVGHSKGGGQATDAAAFYPEFVRQVVNIDGFGPPDEEGFPRPGAERDARTIPERCGEFLDRRRGAVRHRGWRPYPSLDELVARRRPQNPRLSQEWLRYLVRHGARETDGGWVWKADPLAPLGFGPFKPRWIGIGWERLRAPLLAVIGSEPDTWGPIPEKIRAARLARAPQVEEAVVEGAGHFVHMERPDQTAELLLAWLEA